MLLGHTCVCAVEIEPYPRKVLLQRQRDGILPKFPIWDDVQTFDGRPWRGKVDVVAGGFPCQDISAAGKGAGIDGKRSGLWGEMARVIGEIRPHYVFVENSPLLVGRGLAVVLGDLAEMGYDARWCVLGAIHAGAPHKRDRIWIVGELADAMRERTQSQQNEARREEGNASLANYFRNDSGGGEVRHSEAIRTDKGWECGTCGQDVFNGCSHYFGEWECEDCGEWTYPFYYDFEEGCQHCGGSKVRHASSAGLQNGEPGPMGEPGAIEEPERPDWWATEPNVGRVAHGVAARVDRLRCIGNGQVPEVVRLAWRVLSGEKRGF